MTDTPSPEDCPACGTQASVHNHTKRVCAACGMSWTPRQWQAALAKANTPSVKDYVFQDLKRRKARFDYRTEAIFTGNGEVLDIDELMATWQTEVDYLPTKLDAALTLWIKDQERKTLAKVRQKAAAHSVPEGRREMRRFIRMACGRKANALTYLVMLHWIWQVKRKIMGLPVKFHMMPVLQGESGGGKSEAMLRLIKPFWEVATDVTLSSLSDSRESFTFGRFFVGYIEELEQAKRGTNIEAVKNIITAPTKSYRVLATHRRNTVQQNCTFIGTSNPELTEVIKDTTSGRRFWEVRCADRLDWKTMDRLDYDLIWLSINPEDDSPLRGRWLRRVQVLQKRKLRAQSTFEEFMRSGSTTDPEAGPDAYVGTRQVVKAYVEWLTAFGLSARMSEQAMAQRLGRAGKAVFGRRWKPRKKETGILWNFEPGGE